MEGAFRKETKAPFAAPRREPAAKATRGNNAVGVPDFAADPQITLQTAKSAPTEMSICATTITRVKPVATSNTEIFVNARSRKFSQAKNRGAAKIR